MRNDDGTETMTISAGPSRVKDENGEWQELDGTVVRGDDGRLHAKVALLEVTVASRADGGASAEGQGPGKSAPDRKGGGDEPLVVIPSEAGTFGLSHPEIEPVPATTEGSEVRYPDALSGGRDLVEEMLPQGVEESVILDGPDASGTYEVVLSLPDGIVARERAGSIEFVEAGNENEILGGYGAAIAFDSTRTEQNPGAFSRPVLTIVEQGAGSARVRVAVDEAWLGDPARVFPVTIDPVFTTYYYSNVSATYASSTAPEYSYWQYWWNWGSLNIGPYSYGYEVHRSFVRFPLDGLGARDWATNAGLSLFQNTCSGYPNTVQARLLTTWVADYYGTYWGY